MTGFYELLSGYITALLLLTYAALRCNVESAGGELYVSHKPAFALILNLPGKEREG